MPHEVAVVTGGAGPNMGSAISRRLARDVETVAVVDVDADRAAEVASDVEADKDATAAAYECDVTDVEAVESTVESVVADHGGIDVLCNHAGGAGGVKIEEIDEETFEGNVARNLKSGFFCTRAALPHLTDGGGSVVFTSSINGLVGGFSETAYAASKAGIHGLVRCLTADYGSEGVRFNVVAPGSIIQESGTWAEREAESPGTLDDVADLYPLGRYGDPEEVAEAVAFLASERASWISGVVLPVDGGFTAVGNLPGGRWWESL